jgi:hypothetical protein
MRKNPEKRLGSSEHDAEEVRKQSFFRVSWNLIRFFLVFNAVLDLCSAPTDQRNFCYVV